MPLTIQELKEKLLVACDETSILEVLDIRIDEILDRFEDRLEERLEDLSDEFEWCILQDDDEEKQTNSLQINNLEKWFDEDGYQIISFGEDNYEQEGCNEDLDG